MNLWNMGDSFAERHRILQKKFKSPRDFIGGLQKTRMGIIVNSYGC